MNDPCEFNDTVADISNLVVVQDGRTVDCPYLRNESPCKRSIPSLVICLTGGQHWAVEVVDCAAVRNIRTGIMNEECGLVWNRSDRLEGAFRYVSASLDRRQSVVLATHRDKLPNLVIPR